MQKCPACQASVDDDAIFCDQCGFRLKPVPSGSTAVEQGIVEPFAQSTPLRRGEDQPVSQGAACSSCGYINLPGETFCSNCGFQLPSLEQAAEFSQSLASTPTNAQEVIPAVVEGISQERITKSCPNCGFVNPLGETYCQNCGFWLTQDPYFMASQPSESQKPAESSAEKPVSASVETEAALQFSGRLFSPATNASLPLPVQPEIIIGRRDPERGIFPDVDLGGQGSASNSISRRHARLFLQSGQIFVEDLNSTNATYLNRQRLQPGQRYLLKDGDELRLGGVVLIFFEQ